MHTRAGRYTIMAQLRAATQHFPCALNTLQNCIVQPVYTQMPFSDVELILRICNCMVPRTAMRNQCLQQTCARHRTKRSDYITV